ncbi:MAG: hypothetical protein U0176_12475 [Bacteroidia bacterium]
MKLPQLRIASLITLLLLVTATLGFSQKGKKPSEQPTASNSGKSECLDMHKHYDRMFHQSLEFGDMAVATEAIYGLLSLHPDSTALLDTLAALYFQRAAWPQVILVSTEILAKNPTNQGALELRAVANQSMGRAKEALEDYEQLYGKTRNPYHLYEITALQFAMKRFGECEASVQRLINDPEIKDKQIDITMQDGRAQEVPLLAAALNLSGVMSLEQGKKDSAKAAFEAALKAYPEFVLAKNNLDSLNNLK